MFDVGFSELVLCFLVALVVLGPEKLPPLARSLGRWTGQARAYLRHLSNELERETHAAELKKQLEETERALREQTQSASKEVKSLADASKADDERK
jgi:sec-independent protein translocase protein TatB